MQQPERDALIYHRVYANENFEQAATTLHRLVLLAIQQHPRRRRRLILDVDGHRNAAGGYDADMLELQEHFILGFLMPYLAEANVPLLPGKIVRNPRQPRNDLPEELHILPMQGH